MSMTEPCVLVVDPDPTVRNGLSRLFRRHGIEVSTAVNGERALVRLRREPDFDALVLDLFLPDMSGKEFVSTLRSEGLMPLSRVLVLTGLHNVDNATAYLQYGCSGYIGKPYENERILGQIRRIIGLEENADDLNAIL